MVPDGWISAQVSDICTLQNGRGFKPEEWDTKGLPIIRIQNLNGNPNFNYFSGDVDEKWLVQPGQMLFAWAGTKGVSFGPTIWRGEVGVLNQHIFKVFRRKGIQQEWLYLALRHITNHIEAKAHGFKATLVHVKKSEIDRQPVLVPPPVEQKHIGQIISVWDRAIETTEKLLTNSEEQKKALMARLLTGRTRLPQFSDKWTNAQFHEVFERIRGKNNVGNKNVLTISAKHGLVSQTDYFNKSVASADLSGYTLLQRGDFAYNKSYSDNYPLGAIKPLDRYDAGVVSSLYICFRLKDHDRHEHDFLRHYFEAGLFDRQIYEIAQEGARNHGLLNVSMVDFFNLQIRLPSKDEQQAIAARINVAEAAASTYQKLLEGLNREKSSLMQQLLTGKRRVKLKEKAA